MPDNDPFFEFEVQLERLRQLPIPKDQGATVAPIYKPQPLIDLSKPAEPVEPPEPPPKPQEPVRLDAKQVQPPPEEVPADWTPPPEAPAEVPPPNSPPPEAPAEVPPPKPPPPEELPAVPSLPQSQPQTRGSQEWAPEPPVEQIPLDEIPKLAEQPEPDEPFLDSPPPRDQPFDPPPEPPRETVSPPDTPEPPEARLPREPAIPQARPPEPAASPEASPPPEVVPDLPAATPTPGDVRPTEGDSPGWTPPPEPAEARHLDPQPTPTSDEPTEPPTVIGVQPPLHIPLTPPTLPEPRLDEPELGFSDEDVRRLDDEPAPVRPLSTEDDSPQEPRVSPDGLVATDAPALDETKGLIQEVLDILGAHTATLDEIKANQGQQDVEIKTLGSRQEQILAVIEEFEMVTG